jgi:phosphoglycolate phosphatase
MSGPHWLTTPRAVVFDFDLTLVDSSPGFEASHRDTAERLGLTPPTLDAVRRTIGTPLPLSVPRLYGPAVEGRVDEYIALYQARADELMGPLTVVLPGARETLTRLHDAAIPVAVVSQKLRYRIEEVLNRESLLDAFACVLGDEDVPALKPDPSGIHLALQRLDVPPADAIYVGDTTIDAEAAANANLRFVAVLTGSTAREDFATHTTAAILETVGALPDLLGLP